VVVDFALGLVGGTAVLSANEVERIEDLWRPPSWPDSADAYTLAGFQHPFSYYVERVRHLGLSGGVLFDAGCGAGRWSFAFATVFSRVVGFDFTARRIATAKWQRERFDITCVEFLEGDIRRFPADDCSVDAVYCNSVLFGGVPIATIFRNFLRVLRPGGICYVGLNAPGYAYELAHRDDPKMADFGRRRIYNTICRRYLSPLIRDIAPGGVLNARAKACMARQMHPPDLLATLGAGSDLIMAAETIAADLGEEFSQTLISDITQISEGTRKAFGDDPAGRDWEPDEMATMARDAGFGRFEWAPDGCLSLQPDASIRKSPCAKALPSVYEFQGRLRVFEMLMWKP
jgi:ubiquinone/menaquinone biosynthesis C-methylase UbiE